MEIQFYICCGSEQLQKEITHGFRWGSLSAPHTNLWVFRSSTSKFYLNLNFMLLFWMRLPPPALDSEKWYMRAGLVHGLTLIIKGLLFSCCVGLTKWRTKCRAYISPQFSHIIPFDSQCGWWPFLLKLFRYTSRYRKSFFHCAALWCLPSDSQTFGDHKCWSLCNICMRKNFNLQGAITEIQPEKSKIS